MRRFACVNALVLQQALSLSISSGLSTGTGAGTVHAAIATTGFHPRNKHAGRYDFPALQLSEPELERFVVISPKTKEATINWADPKAVLVFNRALLKSQYNISDWIVPEGYLVPPIPSRSDYVHRIAELLDTFPTSIPSNGDARIHGIDIGCGASCIYPLIATHEYPSWTLVGSDVDPISIKYARLNAAEQQRRGTIEIRVQSNERNIFKGVVAVGEVFAFSMCNPPFSASATQADSKSMRKVRNLSRGAEPTQVARNFEGVSSELFCEGGEIQFLSRMIRESEVYRDRVGWFTSLVSSERSLTPLLRQLGEQKGLRRSLVIDMKHGNKASRILCWSFLAL